VLAGVALERHERLDPDLPIMAGVSNLSIALGVIRRLPAPPATLELVETRVKAYLGCIEDIAAGKARCEAGTEEVQAVAAFFRELQAEGNCARHAAFARAESPRP
jgi:hypothetical protein